LAERLTDEEPKREFSLLREFVTIAASVVIPLGLVIYGISSITYSAFYSTLSVDPELSEPEASKAATAHAMG
jgi:hypothetical protein